MLRIKTIFCFLFFVFACVFCNRSVAQDTYKHVFNPMKGFVNETEKPYRDELCLNGKWQFMPVYENDLAKFIKPASFSWDSVQLKVPSPWNVNSFTNGEGGDFVTFPSYPKEWEKAEIGWLKKIFILPEKWTGKHVKLHFEAIAGLAKIYVNDRLVGENLDIFFPTEFDITSFLKKGTNEILVGVAKASLTDENGQYGRRNYVAGSFWGQHIAGIWQDVSLIAVPEIAISDVFVQPDVKNDMLTFSVSIKNNSLLKQTLKLEATIQKWEKADATELNLLPADNGILKDKVLKIENAKKIELKAGDSIIINLSKKVNGSLKTWTPETPNLYGAIINLVSGKKTIIDTKYTRFGWRQFSIKGTELELNGVPITLKADSWHFMGIPQMTRRYAWGWYKMLKEVNANAVRLHAQPYPTFYLDMADEMGICVLDETAIWSSDGGPKIDSEGYWKNCKKHVEKLVMRDRNHPSIFGWSVCNETLPVVINLMSAPESIVQRQIDEINNWVAIAKASDPTRDWISGDGESMRPTNLPTVIGHYGDDNAVIKWSSKGKPWGVGETGKAYFGTPKQVSQINGNRAYESQMGRMEGLATEAYSLITRQLALKASYSSVFNIVWYGLKPLPLGFKDLDKKPTLKNGIFFSDYKEGIPGVQPERLGPYCTTINPQFDQTIDLYRTWPMFDAIQAAYSNPVKSPDAFFKNKPSKKFDIKEIDQLIFIGSENSFLKSKLKTMGVNFSERNQPTDKSLVVIDGSSIQSYNVDLKNEKLVKEMYIKSINAGANVLIWGVTQESLADLKEFLPYPFEIEARKATSFVKLQDAPILSRLENSDFYFSELLPKGKTAMNFGLKGELVQQSTVLLSACNTDWQQWNKRPESSKTASVYRSETEEKGAGEVLISFKHSKSDVILASFNFEDMPVESETPIRLMLANLGVKFDNSIHESKRAVDVNGNIIGFKDDPDGISFWMFSPRSLTDLLSEPDIPKLSLKIQNVKNFKIKLNMDKKTIPEANIPLERGWNKITITFKENVEENIRNIKLKFKTDQPEFFKEIDSMIER